MGTGRVTAIGAWRIFSTIPPPTAIGRSAVSDERSAKYTTLMTALKAHVKGGRIVVDEPVDLPDGSELRVYLYDAAADAMSPEERAALDRALERSIAQADAGELIDADEVLAELQRP